MSGVTISQEAIRFLRNRRPPGISMAELSRRAGLEQSYVRRLLGGKYQTVKTSTLSGIASAWDLPEPQWEEFQEVIGASLRRAPAPVVHGGRPSLCEGLILIESVPGREQAVLESLHRVATSAKNGFKLEAGIVFGNYDIVAWVKTVGLHTFLDVADWLHTSTTSSLFRYTESHVIRDDLRASNPAGALQRTQRGRFDRDAIVLVRGMSAFARSSIVGRASEVDNEMWNERVQATCVSAGVLMGRYDAAVHISFATPTPRTSRQPESHALAEAVSRLGNLGGKHLQIVTLVSFPGLWRSTG